MGYDREKRDELTQRQKQIIEYRIENKIMSESRENKIMKAIDR